MLGLLLSCLLYPQGLAVPSHAAAQQAGQRAPVADGTATAAPTGITPLIGDFDGDHRADVFMYGPGGLPDHVWLGRPNRAFGGAATNVDRDYLPWSATSTATATPTSSGTGQAPGPTCSGTARPTEPSPAGR